MPSSNGTYYTQGATGATGPAGPTGATGATGPAGPANTLDIGTVTSGTTPSATITGTSPNQTLNLVLAKGDKGETGIGMPATGTPIIQENLFPFPTPPATGIVAFRSRGSRYLSSCCHISRWDKLDITYPGRS